MGDELTDLGRDAVALVAHHDDAVGGQLLGVDILTVEQGTIDGHLGLFYQCFQIGIDHVDAGNTAHRGLDHLGVPHVGSVFGTEDGLDAKPVGQTDDGAQIARVLHTIEGQIQGLAVQGGGIAMGGQLKHAQHLLGMLQETQLAQLVVGHLHGTHAMGGDPFANSKEHAGGEPRMKEIAHNLGTFGNEESLLAAVFLLLKLMNELNVVFADHT